MRTWLLCCLLCYSSPAIAWQETVGNAVEEALENVAASTDVAIEDDSWLQSMQHFLHAPLNLNTASAEQLSELKIINAFQIQQLLRYRLVAGLLMDIHEMQAIPGWDLATIRRVLPYVTVAQPAAWTASGSKRFSDGQYTLLMREARILERSAAYTIKDTGRSRYLGDPNHLLLRLKYQYKTSLQWGLTAEKDPGEPFFSGARKDGFDFYSAHLFARDFGLVKALAIGDFTINIGQGLIHWQNLALGTGPDIMSIKRQSPVLKPYNATGEYNFHRGVGATLRQKRVELTLFASLRNLDAGTRTDTLSTEDYFGSIRQSGYHRTPGEIANRAAIRQQTVGAVLQYNTTVFHLGINTLYYHWSNTMKKEDQLYNLYSIHGQQWSNSSMEYSYTYKNAHFFGEAAIDRAAHPALVNGLMCSLAPAIDVAILYRNLHKAYQSVYGNAYTANTMPGNEHGMFSGITARLFPGVQLAMYADVFSFPWIKYRVTAPSGGHEYMLQVNYKPSSIADFYLRYSANVKSLNESAAGQAFIVRPFPRNNLRANAQYVICPGFTLRARVELIWYDQGRPTQEKGWLTNIDGLYQPLTKPFSIKCRLQYFDTDGYNSRIYVYENDVPYSFSIPFYYDRGWRYYCLYNRSLGKKIDLGFRWSQVIYPGKTSIGSDLDAINGHIKSELRIQLTLQLK